MNLAVPSRYPCMASWIRECRLWLFPVGVVLASLATCYLLVVVTIIDLGNPVIDVTRVDITPIDVNLIAVSYSGHVSGYAYRRCFRKTLTRCFGERWPTAFNCVDTLFSPAGDLIAATRYDAEYTGETTADPFDVTSACDFKVLVGQALRSQVTGQWPCHCRRH